MPGFFIDAGSSRAAADREFAEIASALHYSYVSSSSPSLPDPLFEFVIDVFVCAALQYVQKGNNLQSRSTETPECFVRMLQHSGGGWRFLY